MAISARSPDLETQMDSRKGRRFLTILSDEAYTEASALAEKKGMSLAHLLKTGLALMKIVYAESAQGNRLVIMDEKGNPKREIILPQ